MRHSQIIGGVSESWKKLKTSNEFSSCIEACIGVLGIQDIFHFTSRDIGYSPLCLQGYGILCSIFRLLLGILNI